AMVTLRHKVFGSFSPPDGEGHDTTLGAGLGHEDPVDSPLAIRRTPARSGTATRSAASEVCLADQPLLLQGPARQLRQARADSHTGLDQHCRDDAPRLGGNLLG